jgi:hypothetical protein
VNTILNVTPVNEQLPAELDEEWLAKFNASFPYPYTNGAEHITLEEVEVARQANLKLARESRAYVIANIPLFDEAGLAEALGDILAPEKLRNAGLVMTVKDHGLWLYPAFQVKPDTREIYQSVIEIAPLFVKEIDDWAAIAWWSSKNPHFNNEAPLSLLSAEREHELLAFLATDANERQPAHV